MDRIKTDNNGNIFENRVGKHIFRGIRCDIFCRRQYPILFDIKPFSLILNVPLIQVINGKTVQEFQHVVDFSLPGILHGLPDDHGDIF